MFFLPKFLAPVKHLGLWIFWLLFLALATCAPAWLVNPACFVNVEGIWAYHYHNLDSALRLWFPADYKAHRQGVLPFTIFWTSTWPFGTPAGPYLLQWILTVIMILAPPAGDAFNFGSYILFHRSYICRRYQKYDWHAFTFPVVDLYIYPSSLFTFLLVVGLLIIRWRRRRLNLPRPEFRTWDIFIYFAILVELFILVLPWYAPIGGANGGDVSFWYGTYIVVGLALWVLHSFLLKSSCLPYHEYRSNRLPKSSFFLCSIYYFASIKVIPKLEKYELR